MAQEVADIIPDAVVRGPDGYLRVDYGRLGLRLMTWDEWLAARGTKGPQKQTAFCRHRCDVSRATNIGQRGYSFNRRSI
jgi:hypothetical protein